MIAMKNPFSPLSKNSESLFRKEYELGPILGKGAFSTVQLAIRKSDGAKFATKVVPRRRLPPVDEVALRFESKTLMELNHPNIVRLMGWYEEREFFYMPLELCEGGELFKRLVQKSVYSEMEARNLIGLLLSAINYCHERGIMHRDLKPENLLLVSENDDETIKVADFGFAKVTNMPRGYHTQCGTPNYVAPEILKRVPYGKEVDMWSVGVICYLLLAGYPPFHDSNQVRLYCKIKRGHFSFHPQYWDNISDDAKDLIRKMLIVDPVQRITAADSLQHPWFRSTNEELSTRSLMGALENMKAFNAKRAFRSFISAIIFGNTLYKMMEKRSIHDYYDIKEPLGRSTKPFRTVLRGVCKRPEHYGREVAIKIISKSQIPPRNMRMVDMELEALKRLKNSNILTLYDTFQDSNKLYMVLELAKGGELFDRIVQKVTYSEIEARQLIRKLLKGVYYCHSRDVVHRDLKPEKLLLINKNDDLNIKISGFGFADFLPADSLLRAQCGTPAYVAPEILRKRPYGKEVDLWSVGVISFILLGGYPPFYDDDQTRLFLKIRKGDYRFHSDYWGSISADAKDFIRRLLTVEPSQRMSAEQALHHPYLRCDESTLQINMPGTLSRLKLFNARRKFRVAILTIIVAARIANSLNPINEEGDPYDYVY